MDDTRNNPKRPGRGLHAVVARQAPGPVRPAPLAEPGIDRLQHRLNRLEYRDAAGRALRVDGVFGERTGEALVEFQRAHGLRADGVPGRRTLAALYPADPADAVAPACGGAVAGAAEAPGRVA